MSSTLNRRTILLALAISPIGAGFAIAQGAKRVWRVGILWHASRAEDEEPMLSTFVNRLHDLGYVQGRNLIVDHTYVDEHYDQFSDRARQLVAGGADVILASNAAAASAAKSVTKTVPIVSQPVAIR